MVNTEQHRRRRTCARPAVRSDYAGDARIDGVPGHAAPIPLEFLDTAGSTCGALLPTGNVVDMVDGVEVTCIDNGMPVVVLRAADLGCTGARDARGARRQRRRSRRASRRSGSPPGR